MKNAVFAVAVATVLLSVSMPSRADAPADLVAAAKKEGTVNSLGMPDAWANWKQAWADIGKTYGLAHRDVDLSSAQQLAKFAAEKGRASADIGDVGQSFGPIAAKAGLTQAYKPSTWNSIPAWAHDADGHWAVAYTGTIAFISNNKLVPHPPKSWADLLKGHYRVTVGEVGVAAQANSALLAAAIAGGGSEKDLAPAYTLFAELARQGRLSMTDPSIANLEKGEIEVALLWDFTALSYRDKVDASAFTVAIPADGSVTAGYTTLINKYAQHPNAAKLAREFIFSDAGQVNLARGYARPVREVALPADVKAKLLPAAQYAKARPIADFAGWDASTRAIPRQWQEQVLIYVK